MSEGWICPICGRGKAPWVMECDCRSKNITTTQTDTAPIDWETSLEYAEWMGECIDNAPTIIEAEE